MNTSGCCLRKNAKEVVPLLAAPRIRISGKFNSRSSIFRIICEVRLGSKCKSSNFPGRYSKIENIIRLSRCMLTTTIENIKFRLPDFIIPGAAKSGTTTLYRNLDRHPGLFFPKNRKEPFYFSFGGKKPEYG